MVCSRRLGLPILLSLLLVGTALAQEPLEPKVGADKESHGLTIYIDNRAEYEVTVTLEAELRNMESSPDLPLTVVVPGLSRYTLVRLRQSTADWRYNYHWWWQQGVPAEHDDGVAYRLPFASGSTFRVAQGYEGSFSHAGHTAIDFKMPEGTPVLAARGGKVMATEARFSLAGTDRPEYFKPRGNFVMVKHDDGTYAEYYHLRCGGVAVARGQMVQAGDLLGYSGNTGYTQGPHLHFETFSARDGKARQKVPVRFLVQGESEPVELREKTSYTAP